MNYFQKKLNQFKLKASSLWPFGRSSSMPTVNTMASSETFGLPFVNYYVFDNVPYWQQLRGFQDYMDCFARNPVLYACVMIKAREYANMRIRVKNRWTGIVEPEGTRKTIPAAIYARFNKPNVLQSTWEFFQQRKVFREVCGNAFVYGNFGMGMQKNVGNLSALMNVWPQFMEFKLAGKYFSATQLSDIIAGWRFKLGEHSEEWDADEILHSNAPNLDPRNGLIFGTPTAQSLSRPLTNIELAYESRNVIIKNRGMRAIITSNKQDSTGPIPLQKKEKENVSQALKDYGMQEHQKQFFFSDQPLNVNPIDQDVMKLGLFEEIATDAMIVANAFGVPEVLLKLYLQGATFENQEASVRRLYQGTLIPEAEDDMAGFNSFLGLDDTDWVIEPSFDHVAVLQSNKKDEATANNTNSTYMEKLFMKGAITHNQWLEKVGLPTYTGGDLRIWEFTPEQQAIILSKPVAQPPTQEGDGGNGNDPQSEEDVVSQNGKAKKAFQISLLN